MNTFKLKDIAFNLKRSNLQYSVQFLYPDTRNPDRIRNSKIWKYLMKAWRQRLNLASWSHSGRDNPNANSNWFQEERLIIESKIEKNQMDRRQLTVVSCSCGGRGRWSRVSTRIVDDYTAVGHFVLNTVSNNTLWLKLESKPYARS